MERRVEERGGDGEEVEGWWGYRRREKRLDEQWEVGKWRGGEEGRLECEERRRGGNRQMKRGRWMNREVWRQGKGMRGEAGRWREGGG